MSKITLTKAEIQSGTDRQKWAEGLIAQLPTSHDGRNSWLINFGESEEARNRRSSRGLDFYPASRAASPPAEVEFDYLAESKRTDSAKFNGQFVDFAKFLETLSQFMAAAEGLDRYKKLLFYGEDVNKGRVRDPMQLGKLNGYAITGNLIGPACEIAKADQAVHAILGIATESGELVEALFIALADPENGGLDFINCLEEVGDLQWYEAMFCRITGKTFDEVQRTNIAKLRARFPDKFTETNANTRDLQRERQILEAGGAPIGRPNVGFDDGQSNYADPFRCEPAPKADDRSHLQKMADPFFTQDGNEIS